MQWFSTDGAKKRVVGLFQWVDEASLWEKNREDLYGSPEQTNIHIFILPNFAGITNKFGSDAQLLEQYCYNFTIAYKADYQYW